MKTASDPDTTGIPGSSKSYGTNMYRTLWRWHFYAGLFCLPFILALSVTGAIYLFKPQIDAFADRSYRTLSTADGVRAAPADQVAVALSAIPDASLVSYRLPMSFDDAVVVTVQAQGKRVQVYVDPYSLRVLRTVAVEERFINIVKSLHGELLFGDLGAGLVELAGCWAIVLIITGVYLWWPRSARGLAGVVYPRLSAGGRVFWRDLHAVIGVWVAGLVLFLLISGLPWALVWGSAFDGLRARLGQSEVADWSVSSTHDGHTMTEAAAPATLTSALYDQAMNLALAPPVELSPAGAEPGIWKLASQHQNRTLREDVWLDETGQIVRRRSFAQRQPLDRIIGIGISAHEGQLFGWFNQLLGLIATIGVTVVTVSGCLMWYRRRPAGSLGAPAFPVQRRLGWSVMTILMLLILSLPLLALSLAMLLVLEFTVFRRLPRVSDWLGLKSS